MAIRLLTKAGKEAEGDAVQDWFTEHMRRGCLPPPECPPFWLDIVEPDPGAVDWLAEQFPFHPLTIEDLKSPNERGKLETYDGYLFMIAHSVFVEGPPGSTAPAPPAPPDASTRPTSATQDTIPARRRIIRLRRPAPRMAAIADVESHEIHAYLGKHFLVTVHDGGMHCVDRIWDYVAGKHYEEEKHPVEHGPDYLLYRLLDSATDTYFTTLQVTADQIDSLEDEVVERPARSLLEDVFTVKHNLVKILRLAIPMREALNALTNSDNPFVQHDNAVYLRDVHNLLVAVAELADTQRDSSSGVLDAYLSSVNNNLSLIMKRMTIIATIFMPISFIVGFGGMNFVTFLPFDSPMFFWGVIASLVIVPIFMYWLFRRNQWT